jgi:hypothetical protein
VYLYSAEIEPDRHVRTRLLARSKTETCATWTDLITFADADRPVRIGVRWVILDSLTPSRSYKATLSILDANGELARTEPGFANPLDIEGRVGPPGDPTGAGKVSIFIG